MNTVTKLGLPHKAGCFFTSWATVSFSRRTLSHEASPLLKKYGRIFELTCAK